MDDIERHNEILIGRCENQALELLRDDNFESEHTRQQYKEAVLMFYRLNLDVEKEIAKLNNLPQQNEVKKPSDKQKYCPKCKKIIPLAFNRHDECGWKQ